MPLLLALFLSILLTGCGLDLGLGAKTIGNASAEVSNDDDLVDNFVIRFAFRRTKPEGPNDVRTVNLQGVIGDENKLISNLCGSEGENCECVFYPEDFGSSESSSQQTYTLSQNLYNCEIPSGLPSTFKYVVLQTLDGENRSDLLTILNSDTISLDDIIGEDGNRDLVRRVFRYECTRRFLAGVGVSLASIECVDQRLEYLTATYHYYFYEHYTDSSISNRENRLQEDRYNDGADVCSIPVIFRNQCNGPNRLRFGLHASPTSIFTAEIRLAPSSNFFPVTVGYAAETDDNGNCPPGLTPIRQRFVVPGTFTGQPSNFVNSDGSLNDIVLEETSDTIADYELSLTSTTDGTSNNCAAGACTAPTTPQGVQQTVEYDPIGNTVCAIPSSFIEN